MERLLYYDYPTGTDTAPYSDNPGSLNTPDDTNVANFRKSRLAVLPDTTHITLMERMPVIVRMVNDFSDAKLQTKPASGE